MKNDNDLKVTIIGLGNLMEEVFPCILKTIGSEKLKDQVNGTTVDKADQKGKEERLGIKVYLNDNMTALKDLEPDIIFFAPPPNVAPKLIEGDLKMYFDYLRAKNSPIPEIFAFPPVPGGSVYREVLGEDLLVIRILPSSLKSIGGIPVQSIAMATCDHPWPEEEIEQVRRIWANLGGLFEVEPTQLLAVLGGGVMCHATTEMILTVSDILHEIDQPIDHKKIASFMRAVQQKETGFVRPESIPCSLDDVKGPVAKVLEGIISSWYLGTLNYMSQIDLEKDVAKMVVMTMSDLMLWVSQAESREHIEKMSTISATKGGVLEKALLLLESNIKPVIKDALTSMKNESADSWKSVLQDLVKQTADQVHEHGKNLNT